MRSDSIFVAGVLGDGGKVFGLWSAAESWANRGRSAAKKGEVFRRPADWSGYPDSSYFSDCL